MYIYYSVDREGFVERLCENKDRPELKCDGKCMLAQMLNAQSDDTELPMPIIGWEQLLVFYMAPLGYFMQEAKEEKNIYFHYTNNYSFNFISSSYKPPLV
ncbi:MULTISPECIES: hypothetical protein [Flavobacteriaceae]|uniref:hypothetical protein n=1 Tax=Flavobacteriaceae TaxID=49546 RepID=UPI0014925363|nr:MULTISPECIES: hypothetical protein [Allomuricauda]MDC6365399.1 hypothetical protein [Muricauda sp. AC10]